MTGYQTCRFGNTTFLLMAKSVGEKRDIQYVRKIKERFEVPWIQGDREALVRVSIAHRIADLISWQVLEQVCAFLGSHQELCFKQISVNIPIGQLLDPGLLLYID